MQKTSQPTPSNESSETWFDKIMEASRQALLEGHRKYPKPAPVDMEYFRATGIVRDRAPVPETDASKDG